MKTRNRLTWSQTPRADKDQYLTTNEGVRVSDNMNSVTAGPLSTTLPGNFVFRQKMNHFDHKCIPECVVLARGVGTYGVFILHEPPKAGFLNDTSRETPVFIAFSNVASSSGSNDMAHDVRDFALRYYTMKATSTLLSIVVS